MTWLVLNASARAAVEREIEKIRAKGEPVTLEDLAPPPVPDGENAAVILEPILNRVVASQMSEYEDRSLVDWQERLTGPFERHREEFEKVLRLHAGAMAAAPEALKRPRCRFNIDYGVELWLDTAHLVRLEHLCNLFFAEAIVRASEGRTENAVESLDCAFGLAKTTEGDPSACSKHVMLRVAEKGLGILRDISDANPLPDHARRRLISRLEGLDFASAATQDIAEKRVRALTETEQVLERRHPSQTHFSPSPWFRPLRIRAIPFIYLWDQARWLRRAAGVLEASRLPPWEALHKIRALWLGVFDLPVWRAPFTRNFWQFDYPYFIKIWARRDAARIALACELHRSSRGEYPERLDQLAPEFLPEIPPDPFTGKPFVYERRPGGFIVYSLGENLKDDGGEPDDISWEGGAAPRAGSPTRRAPPR